MKAHVEGFLLPSSHKNILSDTSDSVREASVNGRSCDYFCTLMAAFHSVNAFVFVVCVHVCMLRFRFSFTRL